MRPLTATAVLAGPPAVATTGVQEVRTPWSEVERVLKMHYHGPDIQAARALYAAVAAHDLPGQPVWPVVVAPPGSMKTQLVTALVGLPHVHNVASVTPRTFISGQITTRDQHTASSLLLRIGSGIIVTPDFSTILTMRSEDRGAILSDLRCIFDGQLKKEFGTTGTVREWHGRITYVAASTPEIDRHAGVNQSLGDRFVLIRWHRSDGVEAAKAAMNQDPKAHSFLTAAVHQLLTNLSLTDVSVSEDLQNQVAALAEFAARGRMHVSRDQLKRLVTDAEPESPTRLGQQFCQLAKGSARLDRRANVQPDDMELVRRVALDCLPARRRSVLHQLMNGKRVPIGTSTASYDREDLEIADLIQGDTLSERAVGLLKQGGFNLTTTLLGTSDQKNNEPKGSSSEVSKTEGGK